MNALYYDDFFKITTSTCKGTFRYDDLLYYTSGSRAVNKTEYTDRPPSLVISDLQQAIQWIFIQQNRRMSTLATSRSLGF